MSGLAPNRSEWQAVVGEGERIPCAAAFVRVAAAAATYREGVVGRRCRADVNGGTDVCSRVEPFRTVGGGR